MLSIVPESVFRANSPMRCTPLHASPRPAVMLPNRLRSTQPARRLAAALVVTIVLTAQLGAQQGRTPSGAAFPIAIEDAADLWSRADGTGFANELITAAFRAAGTPMRLSVMPYARCKQLVLEGSMAACASMSRDRTSSPMVRFPAMPLFVCYTELLENSDHPLPTGKLADLPRGTRVGIVLGYEYPAAVDSALRSGRIVLEASPSEEILIRKLAAGRVDAALMNLNEVKSLPYVIALAAPNAKIVSRGRVGELESFLGFSTRHPQSASVMLQFESGMRSIRASGELAAIIRRWTDTARVVMRRNSSKGSDD